MPHYCSCHLCRSGEESIIQEEMSEPRGEWQPFAHQIPPRAVHAHLSGTLLAPVLFPNTVRGV